MVQQGKKLFFLQCLFFALAPLKAQPHYNSWFRGTKSLPVNKINLDAELQHRRQNGFGNCNMLDENLMWSFRTWIHYQPREQLKISAAPLAYFSNHKIIRNKSDENIQPNSEFRFSLAAESKQKLFSQVKLVNRFSVEYRLFKNQDDITRGRYKLGLQFDFAKKIKLDVYNEILLNIAGKSNPHLFDHNRLGFLFGYPVSPYFKLEWGYIYIQRLPSSYPVLFEHNLVLQAYGRLKGKKTP